MIRALLDTNVILDVLGNRQPFAVEATKIWRACEVGLCGGYIAAITPTTIAYVLRK